MGCEDGRDDEKPRHRVWVDAFGLAIYQTTMKSIPDFWKRRVARNRCHRMIGIQPSETAVWQCPGWMRWRIVNGSASRAQHYRLPTEASGSAPPRWRGEFSLPLGDCPPETFPNTRSLEKRARAVGLYCRFVRLYNLGQCARMVSDWYDAGYYACSPERNPQGPQ